MTNEELINHLLLLKEHTRGIEDTIIPNVKSESFIWIIDETIKSLEQQPSEDCISRDSLNDAISELTYWHFEDGRLVVGGGGIKSETVYKVDDVGRMPDILPPVTPQRPKGKWIMFDDEANAYCCNQCNEVFYLEYGNPKNNGYRYCPNCGAKMDGDTKTEDNRNEIRMKSEWIPVSERLPEENGYYLWSATSGEVQKDYYWDGEWNNADKYGYKVIAWMPLPEPYKEDSDETN